MCVNYTARADAAEAVVADISAAGGKAIAVRANVADAKSVTAMIARVEAELGAVTILVTNTGIGWQGTLETYDADRFARMRQVKVDGAEGPSARKRTLAYCTQCLGADSSLGTRPYRRWGFVEG